MEERFGVDGERERDTEEELYQRTLYLGGVGGRAAFKFWMVGVENFWW